MWRLTVKGIEALARPGRHADGGGLYLSISRNGGRRWVFLYQLRGRTREMGLGSARPGHVTLKEARDRANELRQRLRNGEDPLASKAKAQAPAFGAFADQVVNSLAPGFSNEKHVEQWRTTLTQHAKALRDMPVDLIDTAHVRAVLEPLWTKRPETASRLRARIERVLNAAKAQGFRTGENPARWKGHLDQLLSKRRRLSRGRHAALPYADVPRFMADLRRRQAPAARAFEFLILTATRGNETRGARWAEFNLQDRIWTIPPDRMKARREHRIPLTDRMIELIGPPPDDRGALVFTGPSAAGKFSENAFRELLLRMRYGTVTAHGFRSSFRDWCSECTTHSSEVAEMSLAHTIKNQAEAAYRRGELLEKRRALLVDWDAYCSSVRDEFFAG